jgi:uncharacterized protein (DUF1501 family)
LKGHVPVDNVTRRKFLIASGVTGAAALAAGAGGVTWHELAGRAASDPLQPGAKILVIVTLYGGNDGMNTLIPYADKAYHDLRPELAYAEDEVLHLDGQLGLNPGMTGFAKLWQANELAIVRGVGYPKPDHSHFRSMDIWQTASPDQPLNTGWIGRWLDITGDDPLRAVNIGSVVPPLAVGAHASAAALPLGKTKSLDGVLTNALQSLGQTDPTDTVGEGLVTASYRAERRVATTFAPILDPHAVDPDQDPESAAGSAGGQSSLAQQLDLVARCIKAGVPTSVYSVSLGGFDTHADEKGTQQNALTVLDKAVSGFAADMDAHPNGSHVVVLVYSEFGRRVAANASQGTDHGTAGPAFVLGKGVKGGFYGEEPSLSNLDNGDLKFTTDFRGVYSELVHKVLNADATRVLGSSPTELRLLA